MTDAQTSTWYDVTRSHSSAQKKQASPTLGHRFLVKFPWVGKAVEVKYPTFARSPPPPPLGLTLIDALKLNNRLDYRTQDVTWECPASSLETELGSIGSEFYRERE